LKLVVPKFDTTRPFKLKSSATGLLQAWRSWCRFVDEHKHFTAEYFCVITTRSRTLPDWFNLFRDWK
jgi:hypothetical protein